MSSQSSDAVPYLAETTGADRPGVPARMVRFFREREIPIEDFHATTGRSPCRETRIGSLHLIVDLPASLSLATIRDEFMNLCDELNMNGVLVPISR